MTRTVKNCLESCSGQLADRSDSPRLDAEILLARVLGKDRAFLFANPEAVLTGNQADELDQLIAERAAGKPVAHLTGRREFWSLELRITPAVLVPRPETELLVEQALRHIPAKADFRLADLGCGSGAIAIAIASERPLAEITATDISPAALEIARQNAQSHGQEQISFIACDWLEKLGTERFNMLVSNPPYVATGEPELTDRELEYEPPDALYSGADGLDDIRRIIATAPDSLTDKGWLLLEHGFDQAAEINKLMTTAGFAKIECYKDLAGQDRVTAGQLKNSA